MRGCLTCRQRHLKCDKKSPTCQRCQVSGRECIPAPLKPVTIPFRHGQNPSLRVGEPPRFGESGRTFPTDQVWVPTPTQGTVLFQDETDQTAGYYQLTAAIDLPFSPTAGLDRPPQSEKSPPAGSPTCHSSQYQNSASPQSNTEPGYSHVPRPNLSISRPKIHDHREATLLQHFQRVLGPWLDACDPMRSFSVTVVDRAISCPLLLYACLAVSARHLSNTSKAVPSEVADDYHGRCIGILLPILEDGQVTTSLDTLLAATVILRLFEQMSSQTPLNDLQHHLLAGSAYISSQPECAISGGLTEASFWAFVIQDIQVALAYQNPVRLPLEAFDGELQQSWHNSRNLKEQDWVHKSIWLLAKTVNHAFGQGQLSMVHMEQEIQTWEAQQPDAFRPLYFSSTNNDTFRTIYFTNTGHAVAMQNIYMAKALVRKYGQPTNQRAILRASEVGSSRYLDEIRENLNILLGIALSADDDFLPRIMACHALCVCKNSLGPEFSEFADSAWICPGFGPEIHNPRSQSVLLGLLRRTEIENGWPWTFVLQRLSKEWGVSLPPLTKNSG